MPVEEMVRKLNPAEQVLAEDDVMPYWFQPEYGGPKRLLSLSTHPIYDMYKLFSGPTHGGYAMKFC
jgi:hypothetical protein